MIKTQVLSECETLISDFSESESQKWRSKIKDKRQVNDLGDLAIDIFNLDEIDIEPVFVFARNFVKGTIYTTKLRIVLSNGDIIKFTSTEINSLHERDMHQAILPKNSIQINNEFIDLKDYGIRGRYTTPQFISVDFVRDFYFNYWIPARNKENSPHIF